MISKSTKLVLLSLSALGLLATAAATPSLAWGCYPHHRQGEVLHRDSVLNHEINRDYGHLSGHYGQLEAEAQNIRAQEHFDVMANGGYLTRGQQNQLNREENRVQRQINNDWRPWW